MFSKGVEAFWSIVPGRINYITYRVHFHLFRGVGCEKWFKLFRIGYMGIKPLIYIMVIDDNRHAVMMRLDKVVVGSSQYGTTNYFASRRRRFIHTLRLFMLVGPYRQPAPEIPLWQPPPDDGKSFI